MHETSEEGGSVEPHAILDRWGLVEPSGRGRPARVCLDDVIETAVRLADEEGYEAVTLAAVASCLGLTTTALYRHVDTRETLTELMVDAALGPAPVLRNRTPHARVLAWVDRLWERYEAHPWLATFPLVRPPRVPHAFAWMATIVEQLSENGDRDPLGTAITLDVLVRGHAAMVVAATAPGPSASVLAEVARRYPVLVRVPTVDSPWAALRRAVQGMMAG